MKPIFKSSRTAKLALAGYAAYLGKFGMGLTTLLLIPIFHNYLNNELFGVWMMIGSFAAFSTIIDFGIGNALINLIANKNISNHKLNLEKAITSSYLILFAISLFFIFSWLLWLNYTVNPYMVLGKIGDENKEIALSGFTLFIFIASVNLPINLIQKILLGFQCGNLVGYGQFFSSILMIALCGTTIYLELNFVFLVAATVMPMLIVNIILTIFMVNKRQKKQWLYFGRIEISICINLLKTGSLFFIIQIASILSFNSDAILIPSIIGQEQYGDYAIVQKIFVVISLVISSALTGLWPAMADAISSNDKEWIKKILLKLLLSTVILVGLAIIFVNIFINEILAAWIGNSFKQPSYVLVWLFSIWTFLEIIGILSTAVFNAFNLIASQAFIAIIMGILIVLGKFLLLSSVGINGAIISTIFFYSIISIPHQYYLFYNLRKFNSL